MKSVFGLSLTIVLAAGTMVDAARAETAPEIARGYLWLQSQVAADGSITGEANSVATPLQNRSEALQVFIALSAPTPPVLVTAVGTNTEGGTESLARSIIGLRSAGRDATSLLAVLAARQNLDGGFAPAPGHVSQVLDTAWSVLALSGSGQSYDSAATWNFLLGNIDTDGGMRGPGIESRIQSSAMAVLALQSRTADSNLLDAAKRLVQWLRQNQKLDGSWLSDTYLTAVSLYAITAIFGDTAAIDNARNQLFARQASNGSWASDPFLTALALRAASRQVPAELPPPPSSVGGLILDSATGTALVGVQINLAGPAAKSAITGTNGRFFFDNLSGGAYAVQILKSGYSSVTANVSIAVGQSADIGAIRLKQTPTAATLRGQVTASASGVGIANASVSLSGAAVIGVITDAFGRYEIQYLPAGSVTIAVSAPGYKTITASGSLSGGQTLDFSPALSVSIDDPNNPPQPPTTGRIVGQVIAQGTGAALASVAIELNGTVAGTTSPTGQFDFVITPGSYSLRAVVSGYQTASGSFLLVAGSTVDVGTITLNVLRATSTIRGRITDQTTGQAIVGAQVAVVGGPVAVTGSDGIYSLSNVTGQTFDLRASATDYIAQTWQLRVEQAADIVQDFALGRWTMTTAIEGIVTDALTQAPLAGAAVNVSGSNEGNAFTDAQGSYRIPLPDLGVITITISRPGYRSMTANTTVVRYSTMQLSTGLFPEIGAAAKFFVVSAQGDQSTNEVFRYQIAGPEDVPVMDLRLTHPSLDNPCCVAFRDTGEMLVVNRGGSTPGVTGSISRFSEPRGSAAFNGTIVSSAFNTPQFAGIKGAELFVAQRFGNSVLRWTFDASESAVPNGAVTAGLGNNSPRGVIANPATGELFVTECCGVNEINRYVFDAAGNAIPNGTITGGGLNSPHDMAFSSWGELFVANADGGSVSRFVFDTEGRALPNGQISGNGINGPKGVDFSPWGELFVANGSGDGGVSRWRFDAALGAIPNGWFSTPATVGDIQFASNTIADLKGIVIDAGDDQPLAGVKIEARVGNTLRTLITTSTGKFAFTGLPAGEVQISFVLSGYISQAMGLNLQALTKIEVNPVRMQKQDVVVLLPDLKVQSVDTQAMIGDPQSLSIGGALTATLVNQGGAVAAAGFIVQAYFDANRNTEYDPGIDLLLGQAQVSQSLIPGASTQVSVPLSGTLPFRDAPIKLWVDSAQTVVETDEVNNVAAAACVVNPPPIISDIVSNGIFTASSVYPAGAKPWPPGGWNAGRWASVSSPAWLTVDLQRVYTVSSIVLHSTNTGPAFGGYTNIYNLYVGNDGIVWQKAGSGTLYDSPVFAERTDTIALTGSLSSFRYLKYEVVGGSHWAHLVDLNILTSQQPPPVAASDPSVSLLRLTDMGSGRLRLSARVGNGGVAVSPATTAVFYDGDPNNGGVMLGSVPVGFLLPGQYQDVELAGTLAISGRNDVFVVIDATNQIAECRENNNRISGTLQQTTTGSIAVATDALSYGANTPVRISATITNRSALPALLNAAIRVEDATGAVVAAFPIRKNISLAGGASTILNQVWDSGTTLAGAYRAAAELVDLAGKPLDTALASFLIGSDSGTQGVLVSARLSTDKLSYLPTDSVRIVDRIANLTVNHSASGLSLRTTVLNPDGSQRWTASSTLSELVAGALRDIEYTLPLAMAPAGAYQARLDVMDAAGMILVSDSRVFTVESSAATASGLSGTIQASPREAPQGEPLLFNFEVFNQGNSALSGLPLTVSIVDPAAQQIVASFPYSTSLAIGSSYAAAGQWLAVGPVGTTYLAILSTTVGGKSITLAFEDFKVIAPPIRFTLNAASRHESNMLVLVSCKPGGETGPEDPACASARAQWLSGFLASQGIAHRIVTSAEDFTAELNCGRYNLYWISGGSEKLSATAAKEIREAVRRGHGLFIDGVHDQRNGLLDEIAGVVYRGKLPQSAYRVALNPPLFAAGGTLGSAGVTLKYDLAGGTAQASFPDAGALPAIITRNFGLGRASLFAFDLAGSLQANGGWIEPYRAALSHVAPVQPVIYGGKSLVPLALSILNEGQSTTVIVSAKLADGLVLEGLPAGATLDAEGNPVWQFDLAAGVSRNLALSVRAPALSGQYEVTFQISTRRNNVTTPYAEVPAAFVVEAADIVGPRAVNAIAVLIPGTSAQTNARNRALAATQEGIAYLVQGLGAEALSRLLAAADDLETIDTVPVASAQIDLASLIAQAEALQCRVLPACNSTTARIVNDGLFTPLLSQPALQARGGGSSEWEWALGADFVTAGHLVSAEHDWVSGKLYGWTLGLDAQGNANFSVRDGGATLISRNYTASTGYQILPGTALQLGVLATPEAGSARVEAALTRLNNQAVAGAIGTRGDASYSESQLSVFLPALLPGASAEGTLRLTFPGALPPAGNSLRFSVGAGNASCRP
jgi:Carboxypeptidase regulatory-like domain/F5/8 type C domain/CARDB